MNLYKYPRSTCYVSVGIDTQYISRNPLVSKITFFCLTKISVSSNVTIISAIDRELLCHEMRTSRYTWKRWIGLLSGTSIWINREQHTYSGFHMFTLRLCKHVVSTNTRRFIPLSVRYYLSSITSPRSTVFKENSSLHSTYRKCFHKNSSIQDYLLAYLDCSNSW